MEKSVIIISKTLTMVFVAITLLFGRNIYASTSPDCFNVDIYNNSKIVGYFCNNDKEVVIPREINGTIITSIGNHAFSSMHLTSVMIPNSITSIGAAAFSDNQLKSIVIPD